MKKFLGTVLVILTLWLPASPAFAAFSWERSITVDHTKVPNTDQSNFPMEFASTSYSFLATVANGGKVQNGEGFDIGFYTNSDCATGKMAWEVEKYTPTTGDVVYWPSVASLSHTVDPVFYLCYGNSSITTDQSATTTVWTNAGNYKGVWHLPNGTGLTYLDSTATGANGTADSGSPSASTGQIDGGMTTVAADRVNVGNPGSAFSIGGNITVSTWSKFTVNSGVGNANLIARWGANSAYALSTSFPNGGTYSFFVKVGGVNKSAGAAANAYNDGLWHLVEGVFNGTNVLLYVDGALAVTGSATAGPIDTSAQSVTFNNYGNATTQGYVGSMDEARISDAARSADWIATEYNNQKLPDKAGGSTGFYTLGAETAVSGGGLVKSFFYFVDGF